MKVALFDCFSGASGDMILGALVDAGLPFARLKKALAGLGVKGYTLRATKATRKAIAGTKVDVDIASRLAKSKPRHLADILKIIRSSSLPAFVRENASQIFKKIARVEAKIHRVPISRVHFHEIGAVDSIVDIVGACYGMHALGFERVYFTPPALGSGWIQTEHGRYPAPSPAAVQLLRGVPVRWGEPAPGEWTTPTGAAILTHFGRCLREIPSLSYDAVGYGIGQRDPDSHPNVLRLVIGRIQEGESEDSVWSIQTNLDDMQPQWYGPIMEKLFKAGALDVFIVPIQMKKSRPGGILEVLCQEGQIEMVCRILLKETTTFGVRMQKVQRRILDRETRTVNTSLGPVRFKVGSLNGQFVKAIPEFEDCQAISLRKKLPLIEVYRILSRFTPV